MIVHLRKHKVHQREQHSPKAKAPRQVSFFYVYGGRPGALTGSAMPADRQTHPSQKGWVHLTGGFTRTPTSPRDRTSPPKDYLTHPKPNTKTRHETETNKQERTKTIKNEARNTQSKTQLIQTTVQCTN